MRSMVQLDAFLVRYVIMNRLKKKEREREKESASQAPCTLARRFIRRGRHARLVSRRILAYVAADTHLPALSFALAPTPNALWWSCRR